jgi:hypothetical protein
MRILSAVLASTFVFAGAIAQTPGGSANLHAAVDSSSSTTANSDANRDATVEQHIKGLHAKLKITPAEEPQWREVAATMRENAKDVDRAIDKRLANAANATAIDDLNSYADIVQAHASGIKKLASAFSDLYSSMPDDQKKVADEVFSHRGHEGSSTKQ